MDEHDTPRSSSSRASSMMGTVGSRGRSYSNVTSIGELTPGGVGRRLDSSHGHMYHQDVRPQIASDIAHPLHHVGEAGLRTHLHHNPHLTSATGFHTHADQAHAVHQAWHSPTSVSPHGGQVQRNHHVSHVGGREYNDTTGRIRPMNVLEARRGSSGNITFYNYTATQAFITTRAHMPQGGSRQFHTAFPRR